MTSSGSGSNFWKVTVPVPALYLDHKKHTFQKKIFLHSKLFYKEKIYKFHQIYEFIVKCEWKNAKIKEIKYTILYCVCEITGGSETVINYSSGSAQVLSLITSLRFENLFEIWAAPLWDLSVEFNYGPGLIPLRQKVTVPTFTVPQHWYIQYCSLFFYKTRIARYTKVNFKNFMMVMLFYFTGRVVSAQLFLRWDIRDIIDNGEVEISWSSLSRGRWSPPTTCTSSKDQSTAASLRLMTEEKYFSGT